MTKIENRKRLAALSFSENLKVLEQLRKRSEAIVASGLRQQLTKAAKNRAQPQE